MSQRAQLPIGTFEEPWRFIGAGAAEQAETVLLGLPLDSTSSFRPGSRFGPQGIRAASWGLETYSPVWRRDLQELAFADLGDIALPFGNAALALQKIESVYDALLADGLFCVGFGGEHLVTLAPVRAAERLHPELCVVQLDAHADLRDQYLGEPLSHASVLYHIQRLVGTARVFQLGIRSGEREEMLRADQLWPDLAALDHVVKAIGGRPTYLTIDIDVVDPAFAPGTGTPEPGGITAAELLDAARLLSSGLNLVACDIVEVAPMLDPSGRTAILAAKATREILLGRRG